MKTLYLFFTLSLLGGGFLFAQEARFITSGNIEFEKTVNMYALFKSGEFIGKYKGGSEQQLFEQYQSARPQFSILKSTLHFVDGKTLFTPIDAGARASGFPEIPMAAQNNTVYADLTAHTTVVRKTIFGETFLLTDSLRQINWKITNETREVAGYTCRRANALIMDSIYVVAFYAEKIHIPGGPESFSGLPGMILELALPHEHVIWRATKLTDTTPAPGMVSPPKEGKPVNYRQLFNLLWEAGKSRNPQAAGLMMKANLL
jgi:GLPGLI family protein